MSGHYMNFRRKKRAVEVLRIIHKCASKAGVRKALYINFGLLLGIIRSDDFIPWDTDIDMCLKQELITPEQEIKYFQLLAEEGLFRARKKWSVVNDKNGFDERKIAGRNGGTDKHAIKGEVDTPPLESTRKVRFTWFSLRKAKEYPKFCHWVMMNWNGITWHSKGGLWINKHKFNMRDFDYKMNDEAILKGMPQKYTDKLMEINFYGIKVQIPELYGSCLDFLYPGWLTPKHRGASSKKIVGIASTWADKKNVARYNKLNYFHLRY